MAIGPVATIAGDPGGKPGVIIWCWGDVGRTIGGVGAASGTLYEEKIKNLSKKKKFLCIPFVVYKSEPSLLNLLLEIRYLCF